MWRLRLVTWPLSHIAHSRAALPSGYFWVATLSNKLVKPSKHYPRHPTLMYAYICVCAPAEARRRHCTPWSQSYRQLWAATYGCWESNSGPLEEQQMQALLPHLLNLKIFLCKRKIVFLMANVIHCVGIFHSWLQSEGLPTPCFCPMSPNFPIFPSLLFTYWIKQDILKLTYLFIYHQGGGYDGCT